MSAGSCRLWLPLTLQMEAPPHPWAPNSLFSGEHARCKPPKAYMASIRSLLNGLPCKWQSSGCLVMQGALHKRMVTWPQKHGKILKYFIGQEVFVLVTDPKMVQEVCAHHHVSTLLSIIVFMTQIYWALQTCSACCPIIVCQRDIILLCSVLAGCYQTFHGFS